MEHRTSCPLRRPGEGVGVAGRSAIELVAGHMVDTGQWRMRADVADRAGRR